ncbi:hypothetical protein D3C80_1660310 [compost metagenome]
MLALDGHETYVAHRGPLVRIGLVALGRGAVHAVHLLLHVDEPVLEVQFRHGKDVAGCSVAVGNRVGRVALHDHWNIEQVVIVRMANQEHFDVLHVRQVIGDTLLVRANEDRR